MFICSGTFRSLPLRREQRESVKKTMEAGGEAAASCSEGFGGGAVSEPYEIMSTDKQRKALGAAAKVRRPFEGSEGAGAKTGEQATQK